MIAIKDMEMPKSCSECDLCRGHICKVTGTDIVANSKGNCPLVEIVTCKDCIHRDEYGCRHGHPNCKDNFYCADAESEE